MNYKIELEKYLFTKHNKVKISSLDIKRGDIFLALKGKTYHGNRFINNSIKKGAKFCITDNKNFKKNKKIIFVDNIFLYLKQLALQKRKTYQGKILGITGSAGKTTLKENLAYFLKKKYKVSFSQKSYNNELGVLVSLLNLDLKSDYAIFEIGTNNFGEIKYLTKIVQPNEIFITNIQSTHLENFKTKKNIAQEKSDIFIHNNNNNKIYLNITNKYEAIVLRNAKKQSNLKIIRIDEKSKKYFIKQIISNNNIFKVIFILNKKIIHIETKEIINFRLNNLLFCYAFFNENNLDINIISNTYKKLKPVAGRGLIHSIIIKNKKVKIIDESYNANPDTMMQSIEYFCNLNIKSNKKILILGNMNELGKNSHEIHLKLIKQIQGKELKKIILCGEYFRSSIKKLNDTKNKFIYLENEKLIKNFIHNKVHNNDIIMIKCSNSTKVNKFTNNLLLKG
tara:strand:+ start:391 stop:1746 length:1356 start_codon:yes stop_codon:yes gene_type:complete